MPGTLFAIALLTGAASGQTLAHKGWAGSGITVRPWWDGAVLYQIDPVSFQDSNGDGFGDLKGIARRLDYLQALGVDAIVLSPFQLQPDFGHAKTAPPFDPEYGSAEDLDQLVQAAGRRKMRLFVDLPLSTGRSTQETMTMARFWLSRGVAGLRLILDPLDGQHRRAAGPWANEPWLSALQVADRVRQLQRLCATFAGQRVLFSELPGTTPAAGGAASPPAHRGYRGLQPASATAVNADSAQMAKDDRLATMAHFDPGDLRDALQPAETRPGVATVPATDGADRARSLDHYGDGVHNVEIAKLLATALLAGPGSPLLYFGQEIGMADAAEPTPMQWGADDGFTTGAPWIDMGRNAETANVALEDPDADSLLNWYRRLSALRHANEALRIGTMQVIAETNPDIVAWVRIPPAGGAIAAPVLVVCNLTGRRLLVSVAGDLRHANIQISSGMMHTLLSSALTASSAALGPSAKEPVSGPVSVNSIALPPFSVYIGELPHQAGLESAPSPLRHSSRGTAAAAKTSP